MNTKDLSTNNTIKVHELIFYIYFLFLFGSRAVGLYDGQPVYNACIVAGMLAFLIKVAATRQSLCEYIAGFAILSTGALTYLCSGEKGLLIYFTLMLGMKGIQEKKVMRLGLIILSVSYFVLYLLSITGIITELNHMNKRSGYGFLLRHSLGYPYPNTAHTTLLILIIFFFYLYEAKNTRSLLKASIIAMLVNVYVYMYTVSLTGLLSISIYLIVNIYLQLRPVRSKVENFFISLLFPAVVVFSVAGPLLATGQAFEFMNKLLHKRYEFALYFLTNEKITPFGSYFKATPTNWYMLDNSFLYLFLQLGIIPFLLVCALYILWIRHLIKGNKLSELAVIITFCFIGMSDPFLFNLSFKNLTFIFLGTWLYDSIGKAKASLPQVLQKEILILPFGENEVTLFRKQKSSHVRLLSQTFYEISTHIIRYALIFAIVGLIGCTVYTKTNDEPKILYADSMITDPYFSHKSITMSEADVEAALEAGDLVEGYDADDPTMYVFKKKAPHMEYIRSTITCGIWAGLICVLILSIIRTFRKS
ncbi:hypothetical protein [Butyrivibrio sp. VCD2006]|uniref:hypothetical protein n=1 Tax=Butyrivibrio sp. VCD2006 TaxID=1280664 RepID=UPI000405FD2C|nr:hypothetical protein [Butyrivibrio sp. VCD2006]